LFVPAMITGASSPLLVHDGDLAPVPELVDLETAAQLGSPGATATDDNESGAERDSAPFFSSAAPDGVLIPLPSAVGPWSPSGPSASESLPPAGPPTRRRSDSEEQGTAAGAWLGLRFTRDDRPIAERLAEIEFPRALGREVSASNWWDWLLSLGGVLTAHATKVMAVLRDPVSGLPDRPEFQSALAEELEKADAQNRPLSLLLINPDEFANINERFGRESGDRIVRELSDRLRGALRGTDTLARYGGVIFAATLVDTSLELARNVAQSVRINLSEASFLAGTVRLNFSIGVATFEPGDSDIQSALDLVYQADQALNAAKRRGGDRAVEWEAGLREEETGYFDRLSGFFTGNMAKDYRNMVLLRDTIDVIAGHPDFDELSTQVVERLYTTFKPDRVGLFSREEDGSLRLVSGLTRRTPSRGPQPRVEVVELSPDEERLMSLAIAEGQPRKWTSDDQERTAHAIPLIARDDRLGCLYMGGRIATLNFESSDLVFLKALASQLAVALDRARLAELEASRREQEQRQLRAELNDLRQALQQAKLVYRSAEMDALVTTARRVAPTDATVLITGGSGTGKELLARTIHQLSPRKGRPMVVVDCGAISTSLIESELFGHERGAYTGAHQRRAGRLAEAHTGTVLLDEIGELPLEVQSKLLRFVQEKQFTTVGGTRPRKVDVRILAASNRDLGAEVAAGRFREDLYYRLNVVRLRVPPLHERPDDILHLARHFLELFSVQYHKNIRQLTPEAEELLLRHSWPGNVRELQNRLMQAVILCEKEELGPTELTLQADGQGMPTLGAGEGPGGELTAAPGGFGAVPPPAVGAASPPPQLPKLSFEELMARLRSSLRRQIEAAVGGPDRLVAPLGTWLSEDLILEADTAANGVARRGSAIVGIPETTFRRRLRRAGSQVKAGLAPRMGTWSEVRPILTDLVRCPDVDGRDLLLAVEQVLLNEIITRFPRDVKTGSALLGVTAPTYRRRLAALMATG
ncbi:MAG: sigma 54-interacting transcriptional regulator, partial [Thermoanaerobaculia bacterium]